MKLSEAKATANIPFTPQQIASIRQQMGTLNPLQLSKLIKDLEDIKRGGSKWRLEPSDLGYK